MPILKFHMRYGDSQCTNNDLYAGKSMTVFVNVILYNAWRWERSHHSALLTFTLTT